MFPQYFYFWFPRNWLFLDFPVQISALPSTCVVLGPTGFTFRPSSPQKPTQNFQISAWPFGPHHLPIQTPFYEITTKTPVRPCGPCLWASQMPQPPFFRLFDVSLAVLDVLCSTPTTLCMQFPVFFFQCCVNLCRLALDVGTGTIFVQMQMFY